VQADLPVAQERQLLQQYTQGTGILGVNLLKFHLQLQKVRRALPHANKARLKELSFYMDQCKYRRSKYSKVLKKPTKSTNYMLGEECPHLTSVRH